MSLPSRYPVGKLAWSRTFMVLGRWLLDVGKCEGAIFWLKTDVPSIQAYVSETKPGVWLAQFSNNARWNLTRSSSMAVRVAAERVCRQLVAEDAAFWAAFGGDSARGVA